MSSIIKIDPLTRVNGLMEVEAVIEKNKIIDVKTKGLLFRGFETMLKGRSALDAVYFTERICGICSTAHAVGSSLALEDALNLTPTYNSNIIRDLIHGFEFLQNHIRHIYIFTLPDYVKLPDIPPLSPQNKSDLRLPDNINKVIVEHYFEALKFGRLAHEGLAVLGGKAPHTHGIVPGGTSINLNSYKIIKLKSIITDIKAFIETKLLEDMNSIAEYYKDYFDIGAGYKNLLCYGSLNTYDKKIFHAPAKVLINGALEDFDSSNIYENICHSWYKANDVNLKPDNEDISEDRTKADAYSFIKAARYKGEAMEVGPLARMYLSGNYTRGISVLDRIMARALEAKKMADLMLDLLDVVMLNTPDNKNINFPKESTGKGLAETTRGSLGHWIHLTEDKISHYTIITPSGWNISPMDCNNKYGTMEKALLGVEIRDEKSPVEIGRIVRSFDPCVSCGVHVVSDKYKPFDIVIS